MPRLPGSRRKYPRSWSSCSTMGSLPESSTSSRPRSRDTGFPEPFCGNRNTTLPHPDANLSPGASISADDIAEHRVVARQRRFLDKHKRTLSHGKITPENKRRDSDPGPQYEIGVPSSMGQKSRLSREDGASLVSTDESGAVDEGSPAPPPEMHNNDVIKKAKRRNSVLRIFHR